MTRREQVLHAIRAAAYRGDIDEATRLYIENRISPAAFEEAVAIGRQQRKAGMFTAAN